MCQLNVSTENAEILIFIYFSFHSTLYFGWGALAQKVTSEEVVRAYIERIKEVNPLINAVVEDRFEEAIEDAKRADKLVQTTPTFHLITHYPILGVPFTVKESCSLKGKYLYPKKNRQQQQAIKLKNRIQRARFRSRCSTVETKLGERRRNKIKLLRSNH